MKFVLEIEIDHAMDTKRAVDIAREMLESGKDITSFYCPDTKPGLSVLTDDSVLMDFEYNNVE